MHSSVILVRIDGYLPHCYLFRHFFTQQGRPDLLFFCARGNGHVNRIFLLILQDTPLRHPFSEKAVCLKIIRLTIYAYRKKRKKKGPAFQSPVNYSMKEVLCQEIILKTQRNSAKTYRVRLIRSRSHRNLPNFCRLFCIRVRAHALSPSYRKAPSARQRYCRRW